MLILLGPAIVLGARLIWQKAPGFFTCALFWAIALALTLLGWTGNISGVVLALGVLSNASVTLANGGFMPVALNRRSRGRARSVWVERVSTQRLLFLADNFGTSFIRFSIGDVLLLSGIVLSLIGL